jgi:hypothetical protein
VRSGLALGYHLQDAWRRFPLPSTTTALVGALIPAPAGQRATASSRPQSDRRRYHPVAHRKTGGDDLEHAAGDRPSTVRNGAAVGVVLIGILPISNRVLGDLHDCWRAMADQECHEEVWADAGL